MASPLQEKYPQYADMSGADFTKKVYQKYYADIPFSDYLKKIAALAAPIVGTASKIQRKISETPAGKFIQKRTAEAEQESNKTVNLFASLMGKIEPRVSPEVYKELGQAGVAGAEGSFGAPMGIIAPRQASKLLGGVQQTLMKTGGELPAKEAQTMKALEMDRMVREAPGFKVDPKGKFWSPNVAYGTSIEGSSKCARAAGCQTGLQYIKDSVGEKRFSREMGVELEKRASDAGLNVPCPQCYVFSQQESKFKGNQKLIREGYHEYPGTPPTLLEHIEQGKLPNGNQKFAQRAQSSVDFEPAHIPGQIMAAQEIGNAGGAIASYTKDVRRTQVFGPAGEYINLGISDIPKGSMSPADAVRLRAAYPNTAIVDIASSGTRIRESMANPEIDHIIGWHRSGKTSKELSRLTGIPADKIEDFTAIQLDRVPHNGRLVNAGGKNPGKQIPEEAHWGNPDLYINYAAKNNIVPRFARFLLPEKYESMIRGMERLAARSKSGVRDLNNFLLAHRSEWEPGYMKLVGPEYGKFGTVTAGYKPIDPTKIDMQAAEDMVKQYQVYGDKMDHSEYLKIADDILKERKIKPKGRR